MLSTRDHYHLLKLFQRIRQTVVNKHYRAPSTAFLSDSSSPNLNPNPSYYNNIPMHYINLLFKATETTTCTQAQFFKFSIDKNLQ